MSANPSSVAKWQVTCGLWVLIRVHFANCLIPVSYMKRVIPFSSLEMREIKSSDEVTKVKRNSLPYWRQRTKTSKEPDKRQNISVHTSTVQWLTARAKNWDCLSWSSEQVILPQHLHPKNVLIKDLLLRVVVRAEELDKEKCLKQCLLHVKDSRHVSYSHYLHYLPHI